MATAAQLKRRAENRELLKNAGVRAALEMLSKSEGTNGEYRKMVEGVVKSSPRFPSLVGRKNVLIPDLSAHPRMVVRVNANLSSSAAGKYQILSKTYDGAARKMGLTDFSPETQDLLAVELMRQRGAIPYLLKNDIAGALSKTTLNKEWASLTGAGYGQREHGLSTLIGWFRSALGTTTAIVDENKGAIGGGAALVVVAVLAVFFCSMINGVIL